MFNFTVSTVLADGLAPTGARPSAGTVMTILKSHICTGPAFEDLMFQKMHILSSSLLAIECIPMI